MQEHWDVIIVGARCAGATLATYLARAGQRVLVLEASGRGTNLPMSTHFIQPPGMGVLDRLGLGERVRAQTPASARFRFAVEESVVVMPYRPGHEGYCVRRSTLDPWLQDTAEAAGATLRFRQRAVDVVRQGERVTGVVVRTADGLENLHANWVVGADGARSSVAQLVAAQEYLVSHSTRAGYFAYYPAPQRWEQAWDGALEHRGTDARYVFRCDGDQVLLTYVGVADQVVSWGSAHRERFAEKLTQSPMTAELVGGHAPIGPVIGAPPLRFFYRNPIGLGYALVGDAGHFKDFVTGQGMTDAFLDAERLAKALLDGRQSALNCYWRERDVATLPLHFDAIRQGAVGYNEPFLRFVLGRLGARPEFLARLTRTFERDLDPHDLVPAQTLVTTLLSALAQGRFDVLRAFVPNAQATVREAREIRERKRLLGQAQQELARSMGAKSSESPLTRALSEAGEV